MKELNKNNIEEIFKKIEKYYNINVDKSIIKKYRFLLIKIKYICLIGIFQIFQMKNI